MKKLFYVANIRLPTEKAHGIQIMKTCEAFAESGVDVTLMVPHRFNPIKVDPFNYYGVKNNFSIKRFISIDLVFLGKVGFWIQSLFFSVSVFLSMVFNTRKYKEAIFYSRDELMIFLISTVKSYRDRIFWEVHMASKNIFSRLLIRMNIPLIVISNGLSEFFHHRGSKKIFVAPDGVDLGKFEISDDKTTVREKLGLPKNAKIVLYCGHLYAWKGVDTLALAATKFGIEMKNDNSGFYKEGLSNDIPQFFFVGGAKSEVERFKHKYGAVKNINILGAKSYAEVPLYLKAANVLVIPNTSKDQTSRLFTSPMKLFEYMASGNVIVASDLPSIREILNETNAYFFTPDDPESLKFILQLAFDDMKTSSKLANQALSDVREYSWMKRAQGIIFFMFNQVSKTQ